MKNLTKLSTTAIIALTLSSCGGGGSSSTANDGSGGGGGGGSSDNAPTGRFSDSVVEGLNYVTTSGRSGATNRDGAYRFNDGDTVTFSIGPIRLGSATATTATLFPRDLVSTTAQANQIAQLLQNLDADRNADNGIDLSNVAKTISTTVTVAIKTLLDGDTPFRASNIDDILIETNEPFIGRAAAISHVEETLRCEYAGGYVGSIAEANAGTDDLGVIVHADSTVQMVIQDKDQSIELTRASEAIDFTANTLTVIVPESGVINTITFIDVNNLSGTSAYDGTVDHFTARRIGGRIDAKYRFTGAFIGDDHGIFTIDIDDKNTITGRAYSVEEDKLYTLTGALTVTDDGTTTLAVESSGGATVTATVDLAAGTLSAGMWSNEAESGTGTFTGSGCNLNPQPKPTPPPASSSGNFAPADKAAFAAAFSRIDFGSETTSGYDISASKLTETFGDFNAYDYEYTITPFADNIAAIAFTREDEDIGYGLNFDSALGGTALTVTGSFLSLPFTLTPR